MTALAMVHDGGLVGTGVQMVVKSIRGVRLQAVLGTDSTALIAGPQPDVDAYIVLETMQAESTVNALDLLRRGRDPVPCLIIALHRNPPSALAAACAGATGYLLNPTRVEITQAIRAMVAGETFFSPEVVGWFIEEIQNRPLTSSEGVELHALSQREVEVLRLIASGMSNAEISTRLLISQSTVKTHVSRLLRKLGVRDRVQAARLAYETGILSSRNVECWPDTLDGDGGVRLNGDEIRSS